MTNHPVRGNAPAMSRRALLAALPASTAALAGPASSQGETRIESLFRNWIAASNRVEEADDSGMTNEESDAYGDRLCKVVHRIEDEILDAPTETLRDLAIKVFVDTGGFTLNGFDKSAKLNEELVALTVGQDAIDAWDARTKRQGEAVRRAEEMREAAEP